MNLNPTIDGVTLEQYVISAKCNEDSDAIIKIWEYVLSLEELFFVASNEDATNFSGHYVKNNFWIYLFTSREKAQKYIDMSADSSQMQIVSKRPEYVMNLLFGQGRNFVYGIYMNESDCKINAHFNIPLIILERIISRFYPYYLNGITYIRNIHDHKRLNTRMFDIDAVKRKAEKSGRAEDFIRLWQLTLSYDEWFFIAKDQENPNDIKPFVGKKDGVGWILIFTDKMRASDYAMMLKNNGFVDSSGRPIIISMNVNKALNYMLDLKSKGVYGIRVNIPNGWLVPISNLPEIIKEVNRM